MCGVAGAFLQPDGAQLVRTMTDRICHRGPDAAGFTDLAPDAAVQLGHRRLSIIDLSAAADQPFVKDGLHLIYNGELYNYRELRNILRGKGVRFRTESDTEVVLECWRQWGSAALPRFRGMFAFALYDERTGALTLARDPLGIKPMYVMPRGGGMLFASELKALVAAVGPELSVNAEALVASTLFYFLPEEQCALNGVFKLPPGSWAEWRADGSSQAGRYWEPAEEAQAAAAGQSADLAQVLEESVAAHMVADVPVASFLSGGLDSSLITALAADREPSIEAYTITFRAEDQRLEAMPDDAAYARKMAAHLGIRLHEIEISPNVVDMLPRVVDVLDEPIGDPAAINTVLMCQAAREAGVKVLLSGMGADELFGGYRKHLACVLGAQYQTLPQTLRTRVLAPIVNRLPVAAAGRGLRYSRWAKRFLSFAELPEEAAFRRSYTLYDPVELTDLLSPDLGPRVQGVVSGHHSMYTDNLLNDHINRMCLADTRLFLPGLNLAYTDRSSMSASTEVRVPFVDPDVFRAAFSFSGSQKIKGRTQKVPLRLAAEDWLPRDVLDRPKASFGAPLRAWVTNDLGPLIDDVLVHGQLVSSGFLRLPPLRQMVSDQRSGRQDQSKQLWQLLSMEMWYRSVLAAGVAPA
ncbi:MAG TPA: asparagine synthase (glutamine-hydrolyzing) [Propionibacteriaceae bacterium]|nr:asparagine synthase (glutamine-hydrolyzing) [Propionibacteriaceae bacterium]